MKANGTTSSQFRKKQIVALGFNGSTPPFFVWSVDENGFGAKYANPSGSFPGSTANGMAFDANYNKIAVVGYNSANSTSSYNWSLNNGFGSAITAMSTFSGALISARFNSALTVFYAGGSSTPYVHAWAFNPSTLTYGTKFADPASLPSSDGYAMTMNSANNVVFYGERLSPFAEAWAWDNTTGFGTKYAAITGYTGSSNQMSTPNKNSTWVVHGSTYSTNFIGASAFSVSTGWGTQYLGPVTGGDGSSMSGSIGFAPSEQYVAKGKQNAGSTTIESSILAWNFNTNAVSANPFGSRFAAPTGQTGTGSTSGTRRQYPFSSTGNLIVSNSFASPYVLMWPWTNAGFGTKYADPSAVPPTATLSNYSEIN